MVNPGSKKLELDALTLAAPDFVDVPTKRPDPGFDPFPGEFRVLRLLGEGAYAKVWLAEDVNLGRKVALKALKVSARSVTGERALQALRRDATLLAKLHHPNVVEVFAWRSVGEESYLVIQYVAGGSLADRIKDSGPMSPAEALACIADVADGLREVHACGIVHRDIKPENILWDPIRNRALLTDFGVSGHLGAAHTVIGTPVYMAPEVFKGKASAASDVYSLSVSLFFLLTSDLPFPAQTWDELTAMIAAGLPADDPRLKSVPADLEQILRSGLASEPEKRISLDDLVLRLRELLREFGGAMRASTSEPLSNAGLHASGNSQSAAPPQRRIWARIVFAAAALAIAVTIAAAVATAPRWYDRPAGPSVTEPPPEIWVPKGFRAMPGAETVKVGTRLLAKRIEFSDHGLQVPFVLVPKTRPGDPDTFYIMENKVSNALYQQLVASESGSLAAAQDGARRGHHVLMVGEGAVTESQLPAMKLSCHEAFQFAAWLGGSLPTIAQWEKAAGKLEGQGEGPFQGSWPKVRGHIAVGRKLPIPVGTASADVSFFGCRDMAGNGLEWTRNSLGAKTLPLKVPDATVQVILRGRSFRDSTPLRFSEMDDEHFESWPYTRNTDPIGFRVVFDQFPP
jgi:eukaryotic-like serine/threonine-protein kinase